MISIITVTYNSSKNIGKLLKSFTVGSNPNYISEVIVIENNSPDKKITKKICSQYSKHINIHYFENKNVGFGRSCNRGSKLSKSKYILFLNPDTELLPNSLEILLKHAHKSKADIIGGKAKNYDNMIHGSVVRSPNLMIGLLEFSNIGKLLHLSFGNRYFYYKDINISEINYDVKVDAVSGAYLLAKKSSFNKLNGFDENIFMYLEDVDLGVRANHEGMKVLYCPHSVIMHVGGASSDNKYHIRHQAWFESRKYYYKKHFNLIVNIIIQPIFNLEEFLLKRVRHL